MSSAPQALASSSSVSFFPPSTPVLPPSQPFWPSSSAPLSAAPSAPPAFSALFSSASSRDFASYQARVLGLSDEYQALGRWFVASGGSDFPAYLSHSPHLTADFRLYFSSGSSCFLAALASSHSLPPPSSSSAPDASSRTSFPQALPPSTSVPFTSSFTSFVRPPALGLPPSLCPRVAPCLLPPASSFCFPSGFALAFPPSVSSAPEVSGVAAVPLALVESDCSGAPVVAPPLLCSFALVVPLLPSGVFRSSSFGVRFCSFLLLL